jgi:tRNA(Ile)-lysidine synthetase-like protein
VSIDLGQRVWDYSISQGLLRPADRVVVGVSGGPDSLCLLDLLHGLAPEHGLQLHVAHLDHGLRAEAAADADFVRRQAELRGLPYHSEAVDVGAQASVCKQSLEAAARDARYAFLGRVGRHVDATRAAVAHTADDQAETVLMHLLRGAGMRGLRGMRAESVIGTSVIGELASGQLRLIRPLLQVSRAEVMSYCAEHNLAPRYDSSNLDSRFFRNRVRNELLPILLTYNPNVRGVLGRTAEVVAGDYELLHDALQRLWSETVEADGDGQVTFNRTRWLALGAPQQRALLRQAVGRLLGGWQDVGFAPLNAAVLFSRRSGPGRACHVLGGLQLRIEPDRLRLVGAELAGSKDANAAYFPRLAASGGLEPGWQLETVKLGPGEWAWEDVAKAPRWTAYVDAARILGPLSLRSRVPGDRFQPLGMAGHSVRLAEFLINKTLPAGLRAFWPLLVCADDIVWVVGLRLDERFKLTPATQTAVRVSFRPDDLRQV